VEFNLTDKAYPDDPRNAFHARKWRRRHIEGYLLHPDPIARLTGVIPTDVIGYVANNFALDISGRVVEQNEPEALLQANSKDILIEHEHSIKNRFKVSKYDIAKEMRESEIPKDIKILVSEIRSILS
jgi:hypothetical protein